ncbi:unnamed protein product [Bursaphelenchus okinawaensis]|uniref:Uncharacterized protein n=1 Tax=Bursaphelenchus okinawaensis TaxID=465554 RepID=A0A811KSN3_9BILA|nr:unnamed protein product [Bursaphelenchus okinawaensis]CAG9111791.1 unnamed protein product [Bursaphelenchus okinawaensis]
MSPILVFFAIVLALTVTAQRSFAITDKVGQGNFAYVRPFAFALADNGEWYPVAKRSPAERFAYAPDTKAAKDKDSFAFAKRSDDSKFAFDFAKRAKFAFARK